MKKLLITAIAVLGVAFANAQESETPVFGFATGNIFVEGNLGYSDDSSTNVSTIRVQPKVGYFVNDKLAVGLAANYTDADTGVAATDEITLGGELFARYYFLDLGTRFKTFAELGAGYANVDKAPGINDEKVISAGLNLGLNYFVKENIAISFGLSDVLNYSKTDVDNAGDTDEFSANINVFNNFFDTAVFGLLFKF